MQKILKSDISVLELQKNIKNKLKEKNINTVLDLCNYSRMELSAIDITNQEINDISISLQLMGFDLKKNHARRNTSIESFKI